MKDNGKERAERVLRLAECEELERIIKQLMDRHNGKSKYVQFCTYCGGYLDRPLGGSADSDVNPLKCHAKER